MRASRDTTTSSALSVYDGDGAAASEDGLFFECLEAVGDHRVFGSLAPKDVPRYPKPPRAQLLGGTGAPPSVRLYAGGWGGTDDGPKSQPFRYFDSSSVRDQEYEEERSRDEGG